MQRSTAATSPERPSRTLARGGARGREDRALRGRCCPARSAGQPKRKARKRSFRALASTDHCKISSRPAKGAPVTLVQRLDALCDELNVLRHPFYRRWERGELTREQLAYYAGEYRHAVEALADVAASAAPPEHAAEERAHLRLWDAFAHALNGDLQRPPRGE